MYTSFTSLLAETSLPKILESGMVQAVAKLGAHIQIEYIDGRLVTSITNYK